MVHELEGDVGFFNVLDCCAVNSHRALAHEPRFVVPVNLEVGAIVK